jgi:hypothetical protein
MRLTLSVQARFEGGGTVHIESMSILAGQSVGLIDQIRPAAEILRETINGAERLIRGLSPTRAQTGLEPRRPGHGSKVRY